MGRIEIAGMNEYSVAETGISVQEVDVSCSS